MWMFIGMISFLVIIGATVAALVFAIMKDSRWKKSLKTMGIAFLIFMVVALVDSPSEQVPDNTITENLASSVLDEKSQEQPHNEVSNNANLATSQPSNQASNIQQGPEDITPSNNFVSATVSRVIDGDTIEVLINGKTEKVRLIGVDTPETVHPTKEVEAYGQEASSFTKAQLTDKEIKLEFDVEERDKYGRLLAYVWLGDKLFNEVLVAEGYAQVATYPPNVKYVDRFTAAQKQAREANKGLWGMETASPASTSVTSTPESSQQTDQQTKTVYVTKTGSKYHAAGCRHLSKSQIPMSLSDAIASGYSPCSVCRP